MLDIHCHILPYLDDGASDLKESVDMVKLELNQGVTTIIATPHLNKVNYKTTMRDVEYSYNILKKELKNRNIEINILLGHEISIQSDTFDVLKEKSFYSLAGTRYILLEISDNKMLSDLDNILYEVKLLGYFPIIAHFERCTSLLKDINLFKSIINEGVYLQINSSSILSNKSSEQARFSKFLLENKLVTFIASDCHNLDNRKPNLDACYKRIKINYGKKYADELLIQNPNKLIGDIQINYVQYNSENHKLSLRKIF